METTNTLSISFKRERKKPKPFDSTNTHFALYTPETIVIPASELKLVDLQTKIILLPSMKAYIWLLPSSESECSCIENNDTINPGSYLKIEHLDKDFKAKITTPNGEKLTYLTILSSYGENISVNYIKY